MDFEVIQRSSTPQMLVEQVLNSIQTGKLKPGDKLPPERELSKIFGVGRSSVREAITALVVMGYLEVIQGKGTFIKQDISLNDLPTSQLSNVLAAVPLFDLMEAREILECKVVELATERADSQHFLRMQKAIAKMKESGDNVEAFFEADIDFHSTLAEAADNAVIGEMMKVLMEKVHKDYYKFLGTSYATKERTIFTAQQIVAYMTEGEGKKAAECMRDHLNVVNAELKGVVFKNEKNNGKSNV